MKVISKNTKLALSQVDEVFALYPQLVNDLVSITLLGDKSEELDAALLSGKGDIAIYAAQDLPYPLAIGLEIIALISGSNRLYNDIPDSLDGLLVVVSTADKVDLKEAFASHDIRKKYGKVTLVGFGPGNPDLLTVGGEKALAQADVIFYDDLLDKEYLQKYSAELINVGKRRGKHSAEQFLINRLIVEEARKGRNVVRLKGGDPMVFAHGGEEWNISKPTLWKFRLFRELPRRWLWLRSRRFHLRTGESHRRWLLCRGMRLRFNCPMPIPWFVIWPVIIFRRLLPKPLKTAGIHKLPYCWCRMYRSSINRNFSIRWNR
jgi:hypothetical protein